MTRLRGLAAIIAVTAAVVGCSGSGGYGAAATTAVAASIVAAPAPTTAAASSDTGGGRYDYGTGASASPSAGAAGSAAPGTVLLSGFAFEPAAISVAAGSALAFTNQDSVKHVLVEGQNGTPASASAPQSPVAAGQTVSIPFAKAGTVNLTCTIHPGMHLTVTVTP